MEIFPKPIKIGRELLFTNIAKNARNNALSYRYGTFFFSSTLIVER